MPYYGARLAYELTFKLKKACSLKSKLKMITIEALLSSALDVEFHCWSFFVLLQFKKFLDAVYKKKVIARGTWLWKADFVALTKENVVKKHQPLYFFSFKTRWHCWQPEVEWKSEGFRTISFFSLPPNIYDGQQLPTTWLLTERGRHKLRPSTNGALSEWKIGSPHHLYQVEQMGLHWQ